MKKSGGEKKVGYVINVRQASFGIFFAEKTYSGMLKTSNDIIA